MVFGHAIALIVTSLTSVSSQYDEAYFVNKSTLIRSGVLSNTAGFFASAGNGATTYSYVAGRQESTVYFPDSYFTFDHNTGKLILFAGGGEYSSPPVGSVSIGNAQASSIALSLAEIVEGTDERIAYVLPPEPWSNDYIVYTINVLPAHQGVSFAGSNFGATARIEHSTGKVLLYGATQIPRCLPPTNMNPAVTVAEAEATVASHVGNISDTPPVVQLNSTMLVIFKPDEDLVGPNTEYKKVWFSPADLSDFSSNRGVLAYAVKMARIDEYIPSMSAYGTFSNCFVNAQTGQLMAEYISTGLGTGERSKPRHSAPFAGELDAGTLTINMGKRSVTIADAATTLVPPPKSTDPKNRMKVMLKRGRLFIQAEFDPKSGLLRFGGKTPVWAKPNPPLLAVLRKLAR